MKPLLQVLLLLVVYQPLLGCSTLRVMNANQVGGPLIYAGTRLNWYTMQKGCCAEEEFGAKAAEYPALDLPASAILDTLLLPFSIAAYLGVRLNVSGGG